MNKTEFKKVFNLPFPEAEAFFKEKLNIPTGKWDELSGAAHAKGFMSAGAYNADLLADLRKMTDKAIAGGMDIREFRKQFRPLVEKYGWQLKGGGPAWRSDLIFRTNIQTAYQAGRWQQFEASGIDYLMYMHNDSVMHPRPHHVALDGKIFPRTDPFWSRNYPPQGFGCKCRAVAATREEYEAANPDRKQRPEGWADMADKGWDYNVGLAAQDQRITGLLLDKLAKLLPDIGAEMFQTVRKPARKVIETSYATFIEKALRQSSGQALRQSSGQALQGALSREYALLGSLSGEDLAFLKTKDIVPSSSGIVINDRLVGGKKAVRHEKTGNALSPAEWRTLPQCVLTPEAVYFDTTDGKILFTSPAIAEDDPRKIKIVVELEVYSAKLKQTINEAGTVFKIEENALQDTKRYVKIR